MFRTPPPVVLNLMIINGLFWLICALLPVVYEHSAINKVDWVLDRPSVGRDGAQRYVVEDRGQVLGYIPAGPNDFRPYQVVSYFFTHSLDNFLHILFNMLGLWMLGANIEMALGSRRFLQFYLFCGIVAGLLLTLFDPSPVPVVGASTAVYGLIAATGLLFPDLQMMIFPIPIPIRAKYLAFGAFGIALVLWWQNPNAGQVSHFGHMAGMLAAILFFYGGRWLYYLRRGR